jgi:hypothetical protein
VIYDYREQGGEEERDLLNIVVMVCSSRVLEGETEGCREFQPCPLDAIGSRLLQ